MPVTDVKVTRGNFTALSMESDGSGTYRVVNREVMFNPNAIDDTKGITWGSTEVPGASHPVTQFGSGGVRLVSFTLYLDGDRGRHKRGRDGEVGTYGLSVRNELYFYRALVHPREYGKEMKNVFPWTVLLNMGDMYQNFACIVRKADFHMEAFTAKMEVVRATVAITLEEIITKSVTAEDMFKLGGID